MIDFLKNDYKFTNKFKICSDLALDEAGPAPQRGFSQKPSQTGPPD